jgi:hypothetical protein
MNWLRRAGRLAPIFPNQFHHYRITQIEIAPLKINEEESYVPGRDIVLYRPNRLPTGTRTFRIQTKEI